MKLQFEKIEPEEGSSFRVIHSTEAETCRVYWHYHPEYEIVFIPFGDGQRRIGTNVSKYESGELVFIGPNLPHLNFSYGKEGQTGKRGNMKKLWFRCGKTLWVSLFCKNPNWEWSGGYLSGRTRD